MEYSIVLTKAAFVHAKYLELYSSSGGEGDGVDGFGGGGITATQELRRDDSASSAWSEAIVQAMVRTRAYVDSHRNCEDIAMQMVRVLHAVHTQRAESFRVSRLKKLIQNPQVFSSRWVLLRAVRSGSLSSGDDVTSFTVVESRSGSSQFSR